MKTNKNQWCLDPTEDLAIYPLQNDEEFKIRFIRSEIDTISEDIIERLNIGPGDDAFIIGRFMPLSGTYNNTPVVRFGNISMLPNEIIHNEYINMGNLAFLIDLRNRAGFSGSPTFVQYSNKVSTVGDQSSLPHNGERLLGICWGGYFSTEKKYGNQNPNNNVSIPTYDGLSCVIPFSRIRSLIMTFIVL